MIAAMLGFAWMRPAASRADQCILLLPCTPPVTAPPTTLPPATLPPATVPPATVPPTTLPLATVPPAIPPAGPSHPSPGVDSAGAAQLLDLVNQLRAQAGLGTLVRRDDIVSIAVSHSEDMASQSRLFHNDSLFTSAVRASLGADALGENVALNFSIPAAHAAFMNSPHHLANIVDPRFTAAGFGVVIDGAGDYWVTEDFAQVEGIAAPRPAPRTVSAPGGSSPAHPQPARPDPPPPRATASGAAPADPPATTAVVTSAPPAIVDLTPPDDGRTMPLRRASGVGSLVPGLAVLGLIAVAGAGLLLPRRASRSWV